ncbi:Poly polymerase, partial [Blyttiomyces helicus]
RPNAYYALDLDFGEDDDADRAATDDGVQSQLAPPVKKLVELVFDVKAMKQTMREMEIDLSKMPLGKLSKNLIKSAYETLAEALALVRAPSRPSHALFVRISSKFFTLVPHDFGVASPPLLDSEEMINVKIQLIDTLRDIEVATALLQRQNRAEGDKLQKHPVDIKYEKLSANIELLERSAEEFRAVEQCLHSTHAPTHTTYTLDQGLLIAPPEAPVSGYMFGKGIYFADMVSKSANYCFATPDAPTGILLLAEVALGDMYKRTSAEYVEQLPNGKLSTKG